MDSGRKKWGRGWRVTLAEFSEFSGPDQVQVRVSSALAVWSGVTWIVMDEEGA